MNGSQLLSEAHSLILMNEKERLLQLLKSNSSLQIDECEFERFIHSFLDSYKGIDNCININGSGGSKIPKLNLSSIACIYTAAITNMKVVKTGSIANTSLVGSSDLFDKLGLLHAHNKLKGLDMFNFAYYDFLQITAWKRYRDILTLNDSLKHYINNGVFFDYSARITSSDSIRRDIRGHHRISSDNCAITNTYSWHHRYVLTNPHIIPNNSITLQRQFIFNWSNGTTPITAHDIERISSHAIHSVISAIHYELYTLCNSAELPDDEFVANEIVEMGDVLFKLVRPVHIVIVGVVSDDDARILHHILDVAKARNLRIREGSVRIGPVGDLAHDGKFL